MMSRLGKSIRILCVALLLAVAIAGPHGSVARNVISGATISRTVHQGTVSAGAHAKCQHLVEHSHELLACLQESAAISERMFSAYRVSPNRFRVFAGIDPLDPPPRA
jgi:hypothetical protein